MQEEALQRFLASVRCERFIDYLDPIGETAEEALARRVRWARMTRNDPAHADEAMFLLQHELALRAVVIREQAAEDGWVEGVAAGEEDGDSGWSKNLGEKTTLDDDFEKQDARDIDESPTGIMRLEDLSLEGFEPGTSVSQTLLPPEDENEDALDSLDGYDEPAAPTPAELAPTEPPWRAQPDPPTEPDVPPQPTFGAPLAGAPAGLLQPRGAVRTANPAEPRGATPTLNTFGSADDLDNPTLLPEIEDPGAYIPRDDEDQTDPSFRRDPELIRAIQAAAAGEAFDPVVVGTGGDPDAATVRPAERTEAPTSDEVTPLPVLPPPRAPESSTPWAPIAGVAVVALLLLGGGAWFMSQPGTPDDNGSITVPAPDGAVAPVPVQPAQPSAPTSDAPAPQPAPSQPTPSQPAPSQPAPSQPTPSQPTPSEPAPAQPAPAPVQPAPAPSNAAVQPVPQPAPVQPAPVAPTPTPGPAPVPPTPGPAPVQPAPSPVQPAPTPAPAPVEPTPAPIAPAPVEPTPAPAEPVPVAPAPAPVAPAPAPAEPAPVEPTPVEPTAVEPAAAPAAPEPAASTAATPVKGLWGGRIGGRGFVLALTTQDGNAVSGSAEVLEASGSWSKFAIAGTIQGNRLSVSGPGVRFTATVDGRRMTGTMSRDGTDTPFDAAR